ncbi:copper resistance protein CopC [Janthinobacterium svalbardensis]|uniref:Copper resistance protein CopC n=1 Tax=Janthinobacterium svalbardensis TaxID=368607 RepID=A0A290X499_9BURK|nr:copper resistance protein CopC [Janthinobacterium svalbardensis]ATD63923.1 copper resistance protein CopC [Janthinobacterium svalbardensis]
MKALQTMIFATAVTTATFASPFASAHASLKSSNPVAGTTLPVAPKEIALTFNEKVEVAFSTITLADGQGNVVTAEKAKVDAANPAILRMDVPALSAGSYTVTWAVAGHDGHRRKGDFKFTVK